jgi:pantoate--beta-alanine ligase
VIREAAACAAATDERRERGDSVGFVPTLGGLHAGHAALIRRALDEHDVGAVSIFLNPRQFGPDEDLERYPHDEDADLAACEALGVDLVWAPPETEVYPPRVALTEPDPGPIGNTLEGADRPGHFAGVLTVVHRLLSVIGPCTAFFGQKDAQQLFLVRRMVELERLPVRIEACPTVREPDGLALSSRNAYLSDQERAEAGCLFLALTEAAELARRGERDANVLVAAMAREVGATPLARLEYAAVVDDDTFERVDAVRGPARALVAARFPSARLIDNLLLPAPAP